MFLIRRSWTHFVSGREQTIKHDKEIIDTGLKKGRRTFSRDLFISRGEAMKELLEQYKQDGWKIENTSNWGDRDYLKFSKEDYGEK